jgi:hypothetical protein
MSLSRSLAGRRRSTANVFVTVKYANRNSTPAHHAVTTGPSWPFPAPSQATSLGTRSTRPYGPPTWTDEIFGIRRAARPNVT